jgi:hypothetical protein
MALAEEYSIKTVEFSQLGEIVEGENAYLILMQGAVQNLFPVNLGRGSVPLTNSSRRENRLGLHRYFPR